MTLPFKKYPRPCGAVLAGWLAMSPVAMAADTDVNFAGFASLVYAKTLSDDKKEGDLHGINNEGEYRDFNKLGLRMDADMKNNLTFTAQIVSLGSENYEPEFDWIFATYALTPELSVSAGKVRVPVFMYSDTLDVSYAYPWIEPPKTVYNTSQTPFKSIEGVKFAYVTDIGDWASELLVWGGNGDDPFTEAGLDTRLVLEDALGVAWTVDREWLSLRAFYFEADSTMDIMTNATLADLLDGQGRVFGGTSSTIGDPNNRSITNIEAMITAASGGAIRPDFHDALLWENDDGQFYGIGASLDFETYFIVSELTRIDVAGKDSNIVAPRMDSFYITGGVRLPLQLTLSLTYGEDKDDADKKTWSQLDPYIGATGLLGGAADAMLIPYRDGMIQLVNSLQDYRSKMTTLGLRWDFHRSASTKFEYLVEDRTGSNAVSSGKGSPQAVRIGLDLVF